MDKKTEKLFESVMEAVAELLKADGFVKVRGRWVSADDLKSEVR